MPLPSSHRPEPPRRDGSQAAAPARRRKDKRPGEIVEAALAAFAEHGFAATRMEDIAFRAGIRKGTLYLYFASKQALFEAVLRQTIVPLLSQRESDIAASTASTPELLAQMIRSIYVEMVEKSDARAILRILVAEGQRVPEIAAIYRREVVDRGIALFRALLERGVASGEFRHSLAETYPHMLMAPALMASVLCLTMGPNAGFELEGWLAAHLDLLLPALRA